MTLRVCEIFSSIQGEGDVIGYQSNFVRLHGCNLRCSWCDTKYAWYEYETMSVEEILKALDERIPVVTITGGEPLLQKEQLVPLVERLVEEGYTIIIETNGTIEPPQRLIELVQFWAVSPKLSNAGEQSDFVFPIKEILRHEASLYLKFVICKKRDLLELESYCEEHEIPLNIVIVQPNGLVPNYRIAMKKLISWVMKSDLPVRVLPQLHRWVWGLRRGV